MPEPLAPHDEIDGAQAALRPDVAAELSRHEEEATGEACRHHRAKARHATLVYALGIPAGTLAVAAGSTALAKTAVWVTALVAFLSAAASAGMAVVDPLAGRADHGHKEADFADFARRVRLVRMRLAGQPETDQLDALEELNKQRHELDDRNPVRQTAPGGTQS